MPDWFSDNAPKASKASSGPDWFELYRPDRKPVSAEDFAPSQRDVSLGSMLLNAVKAPVRAAVDTVRTAYSDQRPEDAALGPMRVLAPVIRNALAAQGSEARKAVQAPTLPEALGHGAAALLPLAGPAAAQAGEDIGSGDPERIERGGGNALALVGSAVAPAVARTVGPRVAPPLASIGEQLAAKGRTVGPALGEIAKTGGLEYAAHALGVPPGLVTAMRVGMKVKKALEKGKEVAQEAAGVETLPQVAPEPTPIKLGYGRESGRMGFGYERPEPTPAPAPEPILSPNAGGRLAGKAPTVTQAVSDALAEVSRPEQPARITTPPQPDLPAGYAPRTTVPKPKAMRPTPTVKTKPAKPAPDATIGQRNYFLRKPAASGEAAPSTVEAPTAKQLNVEDLPVSWRSRTMQPLLKGVSKADMVKSLTDELSSRGITAEEVMADVTTNKTLAPETRLRLLDALNTVRRARMAQ